jgi:hypothetical protein
VVASNISGEISDGVDSSFGMQSVGQSFEKGKAISLGTHRIADRLAPSHLIITQFAYYYL